jgi:hypothetical protein
MANCGLLLNDGSSFVLLNSGGVLLLNEATCGTEAGVVESPVAITGTGTAAFVGAADVLVEAALAVAGEATVAFAGEDATPVVDAVLSTDGSATVAFIAADAGSTGAVTDGGGYLGHRGSYYWKKYQEENKRLKKRKRVDALEELDDLLGAVKEQIVPWQKAKAYEQEQALYRRALERAEQINTSDTLARIEAEIVNLRELLAEADDEEALLLLM